MTVRAMFALCVLIVVGGLGYFTVIGMMQR